MDKIFEILLPAMFSGGPAAIIAILLVAVGVLYLERRRLLEEIRRKDDKIDKIIDDYHNGNMTLSEALNSLKNVLYEIKGSLK